MSYARGFGIARALTLCAGVLMSSSLLPAPARGKPHGHGPHGGGGLGWTVLAPVTYKNLTLFPVRGRDLAPAGDYITLDEGLSAGTVVITEKGAAQQMARGGGGAAVQNAGLRGDGGSASVNELALVNRSGKKLLLMAGEVVVGGKQDRIVQEDRVVPPVSVPVALEVFCVEHGRWSEQTSGGGRGRGGRRVARADAGNVQVVQPSVAGPSAATAAEAPVAAAPPGMFKSLGAVAHPKLRAAAQDRKEQSAVWNEVSANNTKLGTANSTDTYQEVYNSKKVSAQLNDYVGALGREFLQPGVVGVVVARNGQPVWADVFANQSLFARYWPKLLKSYAVDAMADYKRERVPTADEARAFLFERRGAVATATQAGVYRLVKTESAAYALFELSDISLPTPLRLHFNKMRR